MNAGGDHQGGGGGDYPVECCPELVPCQHPGGTSGDSEEAKEGDHDTSEEEGEGGEGGGGGVTGQSGCLVGGALRVRCHT